MKDNIFKFISPFEIKIVMTIMMMTMMMVMLMLRQMVNLITRPSGEGGGEGLLVDSVLCYATNPNLALHAAPIIFIIYNSIWQGPKCCRKLSPKIESKKNLHSIAISSTKFWMIPTESSCPSIEKNILQCVGPISFTRK